MKINCSDLKSIETSFEPPVREYLVLHGNAKPSKIDEANAGKILKGFEVWLTHFVSECEKVSAQEIKAMSEFLRYFSLDSDNYNNLCSKGKGFIDNMHNGFPDNECMVNAIICSDHNND